MQKNVAGQLWTVFAFDETDNTPKTGDAANITGTLYIDGASNAIDDTNPTELSGGYYQFDITQTESNGDQISIVPVSGTSNIQVIGYPATYDTTAPYANALGIESDGDITKVNLCATTTTNTDMVTEPPTATAIVDEWESQSQADPTGFHINLMEIGSDSQSMSDLKDFADAGYNPATNKVTGVVLVDTTTTNTDMVTEPPTATAIVDEWETQSQADPTGFHINLLEIAGDAQSVTDLKDFADAGYDPATNKVQGVVLTDTTTTNTDMVGTAGANTTVPDAAGTAATLIGNLNDFDPTSDTVALVTDVTTKTGYALSAAGIDGILDEVVEGSITLRQATNLFLAVLTGKTSGGGTTTLTFRDTGDSKNRLVVTVDANNDRTAVGTRDGS